MERGYSQLTLKKRRTIKRILTVLVLVVILRTFGTIDLDMTKQILAAGTYYVLPSVLRYDTKKQQQAPVLFRIFAPQILAYTWGEQEIQTLQQEESSEQESMVVQDEEDLHEPTLYLSVPKEHELSLLQENLFLENTDFEPDVIETTQKRQYDLSSYTTMKDLIKGFYIVDASTSPTEELLNIQDLTSVDCTIEKSDVAPQILIYHSHSQEAFADSVQGDTSTTIVGAGDKLTRLLQEEYGYEVLHHTGVYDVPSRDNAYSNALPAIEQVLAQYPSIEVVIDLHRDAVAEGTKLVTTIDGKDYAKFMFFNGICRGTDGPITYLNNPYLKENLAFSFQSQVIAESYFPGVTRKIYLKAWRYNMHLKPKNMLIELGAQTNTVEEIMNTTEIIAFTIDKVLSGT